VVSQRPEWFKLPLFKLIKIKDDIMKTFLLEQNCDCGGDCFCDDEDDDCDDCDCGLDDEDDEDGCTGCDE
jgi:hypothetical protein